MGPAMATVLLQVGLLLAATAAVQALAVHHLAEDELPWVLRSRVARSNRVRPWVAAVSAALVAAGVVALAWPL